MATNTDWSKFQRRELTNLLKLEVALAKGDTEQLTRAIISLKAEMEKDDIERVLEEMKNYK